MVQMAPIDEIAARPMAYIISPYSKGDQARNVARSLEEAEELIDHGVMPVTPLLTHFWHFLSPQDKWYWLELDLAKMIRCDAVLRLPGESEGGDLEEQVAEDVGIPVFYDRESLMAWFDGVVMLARAVQGEGAGLFGDQRDEVGTWIAHTVLNRVEHERWSSDIEEVITEPGGFHGYVNVEEPAPWAIGIALAAVRRQRDVTGGALYMLSRHDLEDHNLFAGHALLHQFNEGRWGLYFFTKWPRRAASEVQS